MTDDSDNLLDELVSEELEGVTFVRDYVQLLFGGPPTLNVYTPMTVRTGATVFRSGDPEFAAALIAQIDKRVREVRRQPSKHVEMVFDDDSAIEVSLRPEDYQGPEAFTYFGKRGVVFVE